MIDITSAPNHSTEVSIERDQSGKMLKRHGHQQADYDHVRPLTDSAEKSHHERPRIRVDACIMSSLRREQFMHWCV